MNELRKQSERFTSNAMELIEVAENDLYDYVSFTIGTVQDFLETKDANMVLSSGELVGIKHAKITANNCLVFAKRMVDAIEKIEAIHNTTTEGE